MDTYHAKLYNKLNKLKYDTVEGKMLPATFTTTNTLYIDLYNNI